MNDPSELVVGVVALSGGQLVSKVRLQKTFYLLGECGLESGLDFEYRYYGPFSAELAQAADDAVAANRLEVEERLGYHEVPYTIYKTEEAPPQKLGALEAADVREKLEVLSRYSALEMEVAATILYLRDTGDRERMLQEVKARKPLKATDNRIMKALQLIRDLGLNAQALALE